MRTCAALAVGLLLPQILWAADWQVEKSEHFFVYHQGNATLASEVIQESERDYSQIAEEIGFERYSNFWTWDRRCKIYIYPTKEEFAKEAHQPAWSAGCADARRRTLYTYQGAENFLSSVLPHELTHLIFRDFVGFKGEIPLWLDEGLAQFMERSKREKHKDAVKKIVEKGNYLPLATLTQMRLSREESTALVALFYAEASLLVRYLIEEHGTEAFTVFCRQLRDGKSLEEALRFAYPGKFRTIADLDRSWVEYVKSF